MKKYLCLTVMMLAMMVAALSFTACGGSDEEDGGGNVPSPSDSQIIKINGVDWVASSENPPLFYGHFDGSQSAGLIFTKFTRKETNEMQLVFPDTFHFGITMKLNVSITKGLDLAKSTDVVNYGGNTEFSLSEGFVGEDGYRYGNYSSKDATGSAVVVDLKENDFFTIKFTNFKVKRIKDESTDNSYETLTIDGTVTYKYTKNLSEVSA